MTNAIEPSNAAVRRTLAQLATSLRIEDSNRDLFVKRFIEVVSLAWRDDSFRRSTRVSSDMGNCLRFHAHTIKLIESFDRLPVRHLLTQEDAAEYRRDIAKIKVLAEHFIEHNRQKRGGQSRNLKNGKVTAAELFVAEVVKASRDVGLRPSVNRNNDEEGRLPKILRGLKPLLPPQFARIASPKTLERIRNEVDRKYPKAG